MTATDMFRPRLDSMIDLRHPLAVLANQMPWNQIETALAPFFERRNRAGRIIQGDDPFGSSTALVGAVVSSAGRLRLSIRLMASLLYLKHAFNLSDADTVQRCSQDVVRQYFSSNEYYELTLASEAHVQDQQRKDKNKLYALHAPEVECIGKAKARQPYEFGVKAGIAVKHGVGLIVIARTFPGNPCDGHALAEQIEQVNILCEELSDPVQKAVVDLGYRGVNKENPRVLIRHRDWIKSMVAKGRKLLKRRQTVEPVIGHLKAYHLMARCWLKGAEGDALNTVLAGAGFNLHWQLLAVVRLFFVFLNIAGFRALISVTMSRKTNKTGQHCPSIQFSPA